MRSRWGEAVTVAVAAAVSVCGLFMIGGTAPTVTIPPADDVTADATLDDETSVPDATTIPTTSDPASGSTTPATTTTTTTASPTTTSASPTTTSASPATTSTTSATTTSTTSATTTSTTSATTTPTTTTSTSPPTVTASGTIVGVGGTVTFRGSCDHTAGPVAVTVAVTREADGRSEVVDTGLTASPWTYTWSAPTDERDASSFVFRFRCATPGDDTGDAPSAHEARVDMVASAAPPARPSPATRLPASADQTLPETN